MRRILVVEDDPAVLKGLVEGLQGEHYYVMTAADGEAGYQLSRKGKVDLIILDLLLPRKNGEEICRRLREEGVKTPILMLTSKREETDKVAGLDIGADDYVAKPFSLPELQARIRVLLRRRAEYSQVEERATALSHEIDVARQIQQNLFPKELPIAQGWEFAGLCRPALAVGGDYYDIFEYAPGELLLALGDVSGKGSGPALIMAGVHSAIRSGAEKFRRNPQEFIAELNHYLVSSTPPDTFVTLFLGTLDLTSGRLFYINCGHPSPLLMKGRTQACEKLAAGGLILGMLEDINWPSNMCTLQHGDVFVLFSDGVTEARNLHDELFGEHRLARVLRNTPKRTAVEILGSTLRSVDRFAAKVVQVDDISLLVVRRTSRQAEGTPR